jgi:uncharacterized protein YhaN
VARREAEAAERDVVELARRLAQRVDVFAAAYPELAKRFPSLPQLFEFATRRKELLERVNADRIETAAIGVETNKLAPVIDLMERTEAKLGLDQSANFAARVEALQGAIAEYETGVAEIRRDQKHREDKAAKLKTATTNRDSARTWRASWRLQWPDAMQALGGPPSATPPEGSKLAAEWREASGILSTLTEISTRLKRMDEDEVKLSEELLKTSQEVGIETPQDAVAGARMLKAQWDGNEKRQTDRDGLTRDYAAAVAGAEAAKAGVEAAHEAVAGLAARIRIEADGLGEAASRFDQRVAIEKDIRDAEKAAMTAGDQMPIAELDKEWAGRDLDAVRLDLEKAKSRLNEIDYDLEQAILRGKDGREALERFANESEVNEAAALRECAAAEMQDALERYLELSLASDLIGEAMAAVRAEQQDPLIKRAAVLFGGMTEGEYSGIEADVDDRGAPVVKGRRANGETESVATLSEGTRDQLFLAFRLASLERYGASAESLPFVADDILVHFDDARAKATLKLLAKFGEHNQVLLFTHHESVHDAAAQLQKQGMANVVRLEPAT